MSKRLSGQVVPAAGFGTGNESAGGVEGCPGPGKA